MKPKWRSRNRNERGGTRDDPSPGGCGRGGRALAVAVFAAGVARAGGELARRRAGSSLDFQGSRNYAPGDDPRHIHWQAFARTGALTMKLYRAEVAPVVDVTVDVSASMTFTAAKARRTDELLAFCVASADRTGAAAAHPCRRGPADLGGGGGGSARRPLAGAIAGGDSRARDRAELAAVAAGRAEGADFRPAVSRRSGGGHSGRLRRAPAWASCSRRRWPRRPTSRGAATRSSRIASRAQCDASAPTTISRPVIARRMRGISDSGVRRVGGVACCWPACRAKASW